MKTKTTSDIYAENNIKDYIKPNQNMHRFFQSDEPEKKWVAVDDILTFIEISCTSSEDYNDMSKKAQGYIDALRELESKLKGR